MAARHFQPRHHGLGALQRDLGLPEPKVTRARTPLVHRGAVFPLMAAFDDPEIATLQLLAAAGCQVSIRSDSQSRLVLVAQILAAANRLGLEADAVSARVAVRREDRVVALVGAHPSTELSADMPEVHLVLRTVTPGALVDVTVFMHGAVLDALADVDASFMRPAVLAVRGSNLIFDSRVSPAVRRGVFELHWAIDYETGIAWDALLTGHASVVARGGELLAEAVTDLQRCRHITSASLLDSIAVALSAEPGAANRGEMHEPQP
jgi:hypothetical protein